LPPPGALPTATSRSATPGPRASRGNPAAGSVPAAAGHPLFKRICRIAQGNAAAAWELISTDLPPEVREHGVDLVNALADNVLTFKHL